MLYLVTDEAGWAARGASRDDGGGDARGAAAVAETPSRTDGSRARTGPSAVRAGAMDRHTAPSYPARADHLA